MASVWTQWTFYIRARLKHRCGWRHITEVYSRDIFNTHAITILTSLVCGISTQVTEVNVESTSSLYIHTLNIYRVTVERNVGSNR